MSSLIHFLRRIFRLPAKALAVPVKLLFLLRGKPGSFEISINGLAISSKEWIEIRPEYFAYVHEVQTTQQLRINMRVSGTQGDSFSLSIALEDRPDLELGAYQIAIGSGDTATKLFTLTIPAFVFAPEKIDSSFQVDNMPTRGGSVLTGSMVDGWQDVLPQAASAPEEPPIAQAPPMLEEAPAAEAVAPPVSRGQHAKPGAIHQNEENGNYEVEVFYATDRNEVTTGGKLAFGPERGKLQYGTCLVNIPKNKELGELPRPQWWKLEFRENPDKHVMVLETVAREKDDFFAELRDTVANATAHDAFLFIHGYNVGFEEAAWRTAQIAYDTGFGGAPVMYSWPSRASLEGYFSDEDNVQYSHQSIVQFIKDMKERSGAQKLHLIAHSMGNRALTRALVSLHESGYFKEISFNQIILAAPDIDAQIFINDIAPNLAGCSTRITLYASSRDKALLASRKLRENLRRAGDGGEAIVCYPGIDTIDASTVDTDLLGHGYFAATETLLQDITALMQSGKAPGERKLKAVTFPDKSYWSF